MRFTIIGHDNWHSQQIRREAEHSKRVEKTEQLAAKLMGMPPTNDSTSLVPSRNLPTILQHITCNLHHRIKMRHKRSPLSERSMLRIRAPSRTDFLRSIPCQASPDALNTPTKHNRRILDALDKLDDSSLSAIASWLVSLRECPRLSDKDFSNGIALRNAMHVIDPSVGEPREEICEDATDENLAAVRRGLEKFDWGTGLDEDAWDLGKWVVLAGVTGDNSDDILKGMLDLDESIQDVLSNVVSEIMDEVGISDDALLKVERERRIKAEAEVERLREEVVILRDECEKLRRMADGRDVKVDRMSILTEHN